MRLSYEGQKKHDAAQACGRRVHQFIIVGKPCCLAQAHKTNPLYDTTLHHIFIYTYMYDMLFICVRSDVHASVRATPNGIVIHISINVYRVPPLAKKKFEAMQEEQALRNTRSSVLECTQNL